MYLESSAGRPKVFGAGTAPGRRPGPATTTTTTTSRAARRVPRPATDRRSFSAQVRRQVAAAAHRVAQGGPEILLDEVQDLFEPDYLQKRLYEQNPEAAYGAVFKLEGVVADVEVLPTFVGAWTAVAAEFSYEAPSERDVAYVLRAGIRTVAIDGAFHWTATGAARQVSDRFEKMLEGCLDQLNLTRYFGDRLVSADDERDRAQQAFLQAAVSLERQASRVVVFTDSVDDVISAHEAEMRAVGIMGASPAYELRVADLVIRDMEEMRLANIRKIFSDVEFDPVPAAPGHDDAQSSVGMLELDS
ncbi:pseudouridine 5'-phosphatase [Aureococcus anophagefferens]|nr:pseudouridine 5'-phosphatase [Aureococcus anophagefferens]